MRNNGVLAGVVGNRVVLTIELSFIIRMMKELKKRTGAKNLKEAIEFIYHVFDEEELEDVGLFMKVYRLTLTGDTKPPLNETKLEKMYRELKEDD